MNFPEALSTEVFWIGFSVGLGIACFLTIVMMYTYRQTLQHIADHDGRERLPNGKFYYIVEENELSALRWAHQQSMKYKLVGYVTSDSLGHLRKNQSRNLYGQEPTQPVYPINHPAPMSRHYGRHNRWVEVFEMQN